MDEQTRPLQTLHTALIIMNAGRKGLFQYRNKAGSPNRLAVKT